ncbi:uncharacterized protein LOC124795985 [Schistocerca piceifrons]|uniref:uncharacterized protein LOC124795985 n=1 Tax=Schistocerca piceifrons TaxID=274613 RepID=UPI001F5FEE96|nr:uncharacterized protein LOC124795985 [Schistocerca piceifrons]
MVYGSLIRIPGDAFFKKTEQKDSDIPQFVSDVKQYMNRLKPVQIAHKVKQTPFVYKDLSMSTHTFVRIDMIKKLLEPPCEGPYKVVERIPNFFGLKMKDQLKNISIDRLKPAYLLKEDIKLPEDTPVSPPPQDKQPEDKNPRTSRLGQVIRFPTRLVEVVQ